jgi:pilus assembly protein CpaF
MVIPTENRREKTTMSDFDYGVLSALMADDEVTAIHVNDVNNVIIWTKQEYIHPSDVKFENAEQLAQLAQSMADAAGHKLDASSPIAEVRMPDGSRARLFGIPVATQGAVIQITKPVTDEFTMDKMVEIGATSASAAKFLSACVKSRLNIAVVGGFNSGKETFLNVLVDALHESVRTVVIQPISTLSLNKHTNVVVLETRKPDVNGVGAITNRHLIEPALDLHPHRLILAELDGTEGDLLINTMDVGFSAMFAMTGNGARDAVARLESGVASGNLSTPLLTIREKLARTIDVIVHVELFELGEIALKRMVGVAEVRGMKGDNIEVIQIFERPRDRDELLALGEIPHHSLNKIRQLGRVEVDETWFTKSD